MSPVVESRNNYRFINKTSSPAPLNTEIKITQVDKKVNLTQYDEKASDQNYKLSIYPTQLAYQNSLTKNPEDSQ
jgi:hypothetical protein